MTIDSLPHQGVWKRWVADASPGEYKAYVMCKEACPSIDHSFMEQIPTVPTVYCADLVSGMNALLSAALKDPGYNDNDKFVFLSESHIPVKPFHEMKNILVSNANSDFCVFPRQEWHQHNADLRGVVHLGVKHHQWIILSRAHATKSVQSQGLVDGYSVRTVLAQEEERGGLNGSNATFYWAEQFAGHASTRFATGASKRWSSGCLDEFWHYNALFGSAAALGSAVTLVGANKLQHMYLNSPENQGSCTTFVHWTKPGASGAGSALMLLAHELKATPRFGFYTNSIDRPAAITAMSEESLTRMRQSGFLFARKVEGSARYHSKCETLEQAMERVIFKSGLGSPSTQPGYNFVGDGQWLDNFSNGLSIKSTAPGFVTVVHTTEPAANGQGTYDCTGKISLRFNNGVQSQAVYDERHLMLKFENGVVWKKSPGSFLGDGLWMDSMGSWVTFESRPPNFVTLHNHAHSDWKGQGTYSGLALELTFQNGVHLTGSVSSDTQKLTWANGVEWVRV